MDPLSSPRRYGDSGIAAILSDAKLSTAVAAAGTVNNTANAHQTQTNNKQRNNQRTGHKQPHTRNETQLVGPLIVSPLRLSASNGALLSPRPPPPVPVSVNHTHSHTALLKNASTSSITSIQSAHTVMLHDASMSQVESASRPLHHSYSMPYAYHAGRNVTDTATTHKHGSPARRTNGVSNRLYADPFIQSKLQFDSSRSLIPFVPRPLTPLAPPSALVSQWLAMLAWETGSGPHHDIKLKQIRELTRALDEARVRHIAALNEELTRDQQRREEAARAESARQIKLAALALAAAAAERGLKRAPTRFGGHLTAPSDPQPLPPTIQIPLEHTAFVCDMMDKITVDFGRIAPLLRQITRLLFNSTFQGYHAEYDHAMHQSMLQRIIDQQNAKQQAESTGDTNASTNAASSSSSSSSSSLLPSSKSSSSSPLAPPPLDMVPYFHVAYLLNLEYHKGHHLINSYIDTQQSMHVQGLKRSDILNGAVGRMQNTIYYNVFQRWRHVVRVRKQQLRAHTKFARAVQLDVRHLKVHFLRWKQVVQLKRHAHDSEVHLKALAEVTQHQVRNIDTRKDLATEQDKLKQKKDTELYLTREKEEVQRNLHRVELQHAAMKDMQIHRLLDSTFDLLLQSVEHLVGELDVARCLNLQDPLRILHPLRTSWEWDDIYQECVVGSTGWAILRRKEVEAARPFFDGSNINYDSTLAHTHATTNEPTPQAPPTRAKSPRLNGRRKSTSIPYTGAYSTAAASAYMTAPGAASLASNTITQYNYAHEVEIILLWFNFHLIQSQRKVQEETHRKKAAAAAAATGVKKAPPAADADVSDAGEEELPWFDGSMPQPNATRTKPRANRRSSISSIASLEEGLFADSTSSSSHKDSDLRTQRYFVDQFTSAEALARRVENFTTSLQDSELMLRLLGEIAPHVADMDMLTHIDLATRARLLIRMVEKLDPDFTGMVTSLDFVHAFNSDRVAGLLARLFIAHPNLPIQGAWFDRHDYTNRSRKPFLLSTNADRLAEQMRSGSGVTDVDHSQQPADFGPLAQIGHEITQLQHQAVQKRARLSAIHLTELGTVLKSTLAAGRRILEDAYLRDELWQTLKTRLKHFVSAIFVGHVRGKPLKLDDPRAQKARELFCAVMTNPLDEVYKSKQLTQSEIVKGLNTQLQRAASMAAIGSSVKAAQQQQSIHAAVDKLHLERSESTTALIGVDASGNAENDFPPDAVFPHGKPQARFLDLISPNNKTQFIDPNNGTPPVAESDVTPSSSAPFDTPMHQLSFELHIIQNLLHLFYEPLTQIWKSYAQADSGSTSGIAGSNAMNLLEFWSLIKDTGLSSPTTLTAKQVEQVFLEVFMTRSEKADKAATAASGSLSVLTALTFDPVSGQALPPKDKDKLELTEYDFIEVLIRIAFLRKWRSKEEKMSVIAEWNTFQAERVVELEKERHRAMQAQQQWNTGSGGMGGLLDPHAMPVDQFGSDINPAIADPLANTKTGRRSSFNANMHDGLLASVIAGRRDRIDETYGLDLARINLSNIHSLQFGLSLRFFGMLKLKILPKANKLDADTFRSQYKTSAVSKLFRKHAAILRKLFFKYAMLHTIKVSVHDGNQADSWSNTIDYGEFLSMLKDLHLIVDTSSGLGGKEASKMLLTPDLCYQIFANVQQSFHVTDHNAANATVTKKSYAEQVEEDRAKQAEKEAKRKKQIAKGKGKAKSTSKKKSTDSNKRSSLPSSGLHSRLKNDSRSSLDSTASELHPNARRASLASDAGDAGDGGMDDAFDQGGESTRLRRSRRSSISSRRSVDADGDDQPDSGSCDDDASDGDSNLSRPRPAAAESDTPTGDSAELTLDLHPQRLDPIAAAAAAAAITQTADNSEMIYPEYLEALAAIAVFRYPNPYESTAAKVALFLEKDVFPYVKL